MTLSALTETGQAESNIPVLKQRAYTGHQLVISSALANTPCADLGIDGVLDRYRFNVSLGTSYTLGSRIHCHLGVVQLYSILEPYVARNVDFGTVYACFRPHWCGCNVARIEHDFRTLVEAEEEMQTKVLVHSKTINPDLPPRRVWDLCANRVVPFRGMRVWPYPISHAWVDDKDRVDVMTPVNGYEWPVPMPKDANLDLIRIEMLNLGAEYAWLDVLCLRQEGGKGEHLRMEEWKLDVPHDRSVYEVAHVVCYFNGLGRPLHLTLDDFESDRSWFRRAWTLQEITRDPIIGGETDNDTMEKEVWQMFHKKLAYLREIREWGMIHEILSEMRNRVSTKPLDKVAGLVYLLQTKPLPIYNPGQSEEEGMGSTRGFNASLD